jgi:hypothetical protein
VIQKKIVFIGASNLMFNYDFAAIEKSFPDYKVFSCTHYEPCGIQVLLNNLTRLKNRNKSILVLDLPYTFYTANKFIPVESEEFLSLYSKSSLYHLLDIHFFLKQSIKVPYSLIGNMYHLYENKGNIDPIFYPAKNCQSKNNFRNINSNTKDFFVKADEIERNYLEFLHKEIRKLGFKRYYFVFPPILQNNFQIEKQELKLLESKFNFINDFNESIYPIDCFFDKCHHLNYLGRNLCTQQIIRKLSSKLINVEE